ncbi:MAG TPA: sugar ABC transporter permease [Streptosporangiaceae bacterium]
MAITAERAAPSAAPSSTVSRTARFAGYPFVVPALVVVLAIMSYPFVYSVYLSFQSTPSYTTATRFDGLANYLAVLHDHTFIQALENTLTWAAASTVLGVLLGLGAALLVQQLRLFRGPIRAALMLPYIVGYVVASYAWLWLFQGEYGLINVTLQSWHLTSHPISFLSSLTWAFPAVILANIWKTFPFAMVMLLAGLQGVPNEPVLAARLDRASHWRIFWEVKLPYLRRVLVITTMLLAFQNFNTFTIPYIMTGGGPLNHTEIVSNYIYDSAFTNLNFGLAAAASIIVIIILMIFAVFYVRALGREQASDRRMV